MKILSIAAGTGTGINHDVDNSTLDSSTPFGYDLILINPGNPSSMYGTNSRGHVDSRWKNAITKWANPKRKIIVLMNRLSQSSLHWLPIDNRSLLALMGLEDAGTSNYLGNVVSTEPLIRRFLTENKSQFKINTYLRYDTPDTNIIANSQVDDTLVTSFTYKKDNLEIIFVPLIAMPSLGSIFSSLDTPVNAWGITDADDLMAKISQIDAEINELHNKRDTIDKELSGLNTQISSTIESDIYLSRAIGHYDAAKGSENPTPEGYYGAVEAIENAFSSEREMREQLGLSKAYVEKVMRRANDFRHETKSGQAPTPLSSEEISDFNQRVNKIISSYIQYLLDKSN
jgi:hypothetical protein